MAKILKQVVICDAINKIDVCNETRVPTLDRTADTHTIQNTIQDAEKKAYQSGYQNGLADGKEQESLRLHSQIEALTTLLHRIPDAICENRLNLTTEISDIVLLVAGQLFINQQQNKLIITHQVAEILTQLNHKQTIEIALHPQDLALIKQGEIHLDAGTYKNLRLVPDDDLRLGGCIIRSEHGVFNASIERQIDNLKQVLLDMRNETKNA